MKTWNETNATRIVGLSIQGARTRGYVSAGGTYAHHEYLPNSHLTDTFIYTVTSDAAGYNETHIIDGFRVAGYYSHESIIFYYTKMKIDANGNVTYY